MIIFLLADNASVKLNMEWIGCTACETFAFKLECDLETRVRSHSRSSKAAPFDRAHMTLSPSSIRLYLLPFPRYSRILVENHYPPLYSAPPLGWSHQIYATILGDEKLEWLAYQMLKKFDDTFSRFDTKHACDRRTDRRNCRGMYAMRHICCSA